MLKHTAKKWQLFLHISLAYFTSMFHFTYTSTGYVRWKNSDYSESQKNSTSGKYVYYV